MRKWICWQAEIRGKEKYGWNICVLQKRRENVVSLFDKVPRDTHTQKQRNAGNDDDFLPWKKNPTISLIFFSFRRRVILVYCMGLPFCFNSWDVDGTHTSFMQKKRGGNMGMPPKYQLTSYRLPTFLTCCTMFTYTVAIATKKSPKLMTCNVRTSVSVKV